MQISLNTHLINILLETDTLLLLKKNKSNKNIKLNTHFSKITPSINTLNLFELIKSIKQFIRFLFILYKSKHGCLKISSFKDEILDVFNLFFKKYPINSSIKLVKYDKKLELNLKNLTQILILLEDKLTTITDAKSFFSKKLFLINKINDITEYKNLGFYKIYNSLNDFKKLILIFVIIYQTLNLKIKSN